MTGAAAVLKCRRHLPGLVLLVLAAGCAHLGPPTAPSARTASNASAAVDARDRPCIATSHGCIALNPDVTPANVKATICVPGFATTVRPSTRYTQGIKQRLLRDAGLDPAAMSDYELDHIVPLALGGHPRKPSNLCRAALLYDLLRNGHKHRLPW